MQICKKGLKQLKNGISKKKFKIWLGIFASESHKVVKITETYTLPPPPS